MNSTQLAERDPNAGVSLQQMERVAAAMAASGFYGIRTKEEGVALMLVAQADGIHFAAAVRDHHVINGRPALKADALMARFQAAGGKVEWTKYTDDVVEGRFSHPSGGSVLVSWDKARVAMAGLDKSPNHAKYPRAMKRSRCISEGVRTVFPGTSVGVYTVEEAQDMEYLEAPRTQVAESPQAAAPLGKVEGDSGTGLTDPEIEEHTQAITNAPDDAALRSAFKSAWKHGTEAKDETARTFFKKIYDEQKLARGIAE